MFLSMLEFLFSRERNLRKNEVGSPIAMLKSENKNHLDDLIEDLVESLASHLPPQAVLRLSAASSGLYEGLAKV